MAIQLPASKTRPAAILIHIARSALGDIFCSAKNVSRRLRKTFGKAAGADGSSVWREELSDRKRSSISRSRGIVALVSNVSSASTNPANSVQRTRLAAWIEFESEADALLCCTRSTQVMLSLNLRQNQQALKQRTQYPSQQVTKPPLFSSVNTQFRG
jgi:hypothetical protein